MMNDRNSYQMRLKTEKDFALRTTFRFTGYLVLACHVDGRAAPRPTFDQDHESRNRLSDDSNNGARQCCPACQ